MKTKTQLIYSLLFATLISLCAADDIVSFPKPDRIRYDRQCLTIENKDVFIYGASFHYFRCPRELWRDRFQKIKEAGFNAVDTYVPWNYHEREMPASPDDTSKIDLSELVAWMKMAHEEFGLYTVIRPGPYICAEWDGGGFPRWLLTLKPETYPSKLWLRSSEPVYTAWARHWMDAVCKVVVPEQITHKPKGKAGVILFNLENEFKLNYPLDRDVKKEVMRTLYRDAKKAGIEVPMCANETHEVINPSDPDLKNVFFALDLYPNFESQSMFNSLIGLRRIMARAPAMLGEMQSGWFSQVGGSLSEDAGHNAAHFNHLSLLCIEREVTIINYYMLCGGSNFGNWFGRMGNAATTTYDYNAPIREWGGVGERYAAAKAVGLMLKDHGVVLARSKLLEAKVETGSPDVAAAIREGADGQTFIFVRNNHRNEGRSGNATVETGSKKFAFGYDLKPFDARMLRIPPGETDVAKGEWLPKPVALPERPEITAKPVRISEAKMLVDDTVTSWRSVKPGQLLPALGVYDSRTVLYRARPQLTASDIAEKSLLEINANRSFNLCARVNGQLFTETKREGDKQYIDVRSALKPGENEIILLHESTGQENIGPEINDIQGIVSVGFVNSGISLGKWSVRLLKEGESPTPFVGLDTDVSGWPSFNFDQKTVANLQAAVMPGVSIADDDAARILYGRQAAAVFRSDFDLKETKTKAAVISLLIPSIDDKGEVFLNGESIGNANDSNKSFKADLHEKVKIGRNVLAMVITNQEGPGGLKRAPEIKHSGGQEMALEIGVQLSGEAKLGWTATTATGDWKTVSLDATKPIARKGRNAPQGKAENLQVWYRMEFELPEPQSGVWVPWQALLEASGSGTVYLNGHHLGRYWQNGPQRSYFLPECWLKFGKGNCKILSMGLRSTAQGAVLGAAEIAPYTEYAEKER